MAKKFVPTDQDDGDWVEEETNKALAKIDATPPAMVVITSNDDLQEASAALVSIASKVKKLNDERMSITRPIDAAKANVVAKFKPFIDELAAREAALRKAITTYQSERAAAQRAEEARLRDERQALQVAAEKKALRLASEGKQNQAIAVLANVPPVPTVIENRPATPGVTAREVWKYRITSLLDLSVWAFQTQNTDYIQANDKLLGEMARSHHGKTKIPGVEFYPEAGLSVRRS